MKIICPNKDTTEWEALVNSLGNENAAYVAYFRNNGSIPAAGDATRLLGVKAAETPESVLSKSYNIKVAMPKGATFLQLTVKNPRTGRENIYDFVTRKDLESGNVYAGNDVIKVSAGIKGKGGEFVPSNEKPRITPAEKQASIGAKEKPVEQAPVVTQSVAELRAALPKSGLEESQQNLIRFFLDSKIASALEGVRVRIADTLARGWQGSYFNGVVQLARNAAADTGVHEFAHRVWELLPDDVRAQFGVMRREAIDRLLQKPMNYAQIEPLQELKDNPTSGGQEFESRGYPMEAYPYSSDEEFFTHSMSDQFAERLSVSQQGVWQRVKQFFKDFWSAIKKYAGLNQTQTDLLNNVINGHFKLLAEENASEKAPTEVEQASLAPDTTQVMGAEKGIGSREHLTDQTRQQSIDAAKQFFDEAKVPVTLETIPDPRRNNAPIQIWVADTSFDLNPEGRKLIEILKRELPRQFEQGRSPEYLTSLLRSITYNLETGRLSQKLSDGQDVMSVDIRRQLSQLVQSDASWKGMMLGALSRHSIDLDKSVLDPELHLQRTWSQNFGGDALDSFFQRIIEHFRTLFSTEEIEDARKSAPALGDFLDRAILQNFQDEGGRVFRKVQAQWKAKFAPKLSKILLDARVNEAARAIIEEAQKRFNIQPKPSKKVDITPYEKLLHLVNESNASKVAGLMKGAVRDAEYNVGKRAMTDALKTEPDLQKRQDIADHLALMESDEKVLPLPEYVEKGLNLPEYANWKVVRDNWFDYSPITEKLIEQVLSGDFKGTKFGEKNAKVKPQDTRIDLNKLATSPDDEVKRVLEAYYNNLDESMDINGASAATRQRMRAMIQDKVTKQLEEARQRARDAMFKIPKKRGAVITPEVKLSQQIYTKLFSDERLSTPEMVARIASKSMIQRLTPTVADLVKEVLNTPRIYQGRMTDTFADEFTARVTAQFNLSPKETENLRKVIVEAFGARLAAARKKAFDVAVASMKPREIEVLPRSNTKLWHKIERLSNTGALDTAAALQEIARMHGQKPPTPEVVSQLRSLAEREQALRTPTDVEYREIQNDPKLSPEQKAERLAARTQKLRDMTRNSRAQMIREMATIWARIFKPLSWKHWFAGREIMRNNVRALNEYETLDMLTKIGFPFRILTHILTQLTLHTPTRSLGRARLLRIADIEKNGPGARPGFAIADQTYWHDVATAITDSYKATAAALKPALLSAKAELLGRGETRNVDRIMSGINTLDRIAKKADEEMKAGRPWNAAILHFINTPRLIQWYISAVDNFQGKPTEYQELIHRIEIAMREDGRSRAEIESFKEEIFESMRNEFPTAVAETAHFYESRGIEKPYEEIEEEANNLIVRRVYEQMSRMGLPADAFEQAINLLKSTVSWQESTTRGIGGIFANALRGVSSAGESVGIPTSIARLSNAIGTGINYALMNTPLYKLAQVGGSGEESPWFRTKLDREQRMAQAIIGSLLGTTAIALVAAGRVAVVGAPPLDKKQREDFYAQGHHPGTVEFYLPDGSFIPVSLTVGPVSLVAPYFMGAGAVANLMKQRAAQQAKLDAEAKATGRPAGKIKDISPADVMMLAADAAAGTIMTARTATGLAASLSEQGVPNSRKAISSFISPLVPLLPAYQEISRMMGVSMDSKLASVWDYMVPLPTSGARAVNLLGDPVETPNDVQRVFQTIMAGSYPLPVDPGAIKAQNAYAALFSTDYRPPAVNTLRGYNIKGDFRPMTDDELERYTVARGQYLKQNLSELGANATKQQVQEAYQDANSRALADVGASVPARAATQRGGRASAARPGARQRTRRVSLRGSLRASKAPKIRIKKLRRPRTSHFSTARRHIRVPGFRRVRLATVKPHRPRVRRPTIYI